MRIAALYDIHGNLPALAAVLADVDALDVDTIIVGGDVSWGPMPAPCLDALRDRHAQFIRGNADRIFHQPPVDPPDLREQARRWAAERLGPERIDFLGSLPLELTLDVEGLGAVRFCHASPGSDEVAITRLTSPARLADLMTGVDEDVVVCGHTHVQFDRAAGGVRVVNAGSVGRTYEDSSVAYWALLDGDLELRRTDYDVTEGVRAILATGFPLSEGVVRDLSPDPERAERISRVIEDAADAAWRRDRG